MYFRKVISEYLAHEPVYADGFASLLALSTCITFLIVINEFLEVLQRHFFSFVHWHVNLLLAFAHEQLNKTVSKCLEILDHADLHIFVIFDLKHPVLKDVSRTITITIWSSFRTSNFFIFHLCGLGILNILYLLQFINGILGLHHLSKVGVSMGVLAFIITQYGIVVHEHFTCFIE